MQYRRGRFLCPPCCDGASVLIHWAAILAVDVERATQPVFKDALGSVSSLDGRGLFPATLFAIHTLDAYGIMEGAALTHN